MIVKLQELRRLAPLWVLALAVFLVPAGTAGASERQAGAKAYQLAQLVFCIPPKVWSKRAKRCVNPFVKKRVRCKAPRIWSRKQKRCVFPVVDDPRCGARETWSQSADACVCRQGYERVGEQCEAVTNAAIGPDYREIQRCLNQLGFNAGAVDGQPGQRTRRAWKARGNAEHGDHG